MCQVLFKALYLIITILNDVSNQYCLPFRDEETGAERSLAKGHRANGWQSWTLAVHLHHSNPWA